MVERVDYEAVHRHHRIFYSKTRNFLSTDKIDIETKESNCFLSLKCKIFLNLFIAYRFFLCSFDPLNEFTIVSLFALSLNSKKKNHTLRWQPSPELILNGMMEWKKACSEFIDECINFQPFKSIASISMCAHSKHSFISTVTPNTHQLSSYNHDMAQACAAPYNRSTGTQPHCVSHIHAV